MTIPRNAAGSLLVAAVLAALAIPALAQPMPEPGNCAAGMPPPPSVFGHAPTEGEGPLPPFMHGLMLSEAQRDKIFDILHAQAPKLRQHHKALRKAREALRLLALSTRYDEAHARALAEDGAEAMAQIALLHAQADHELFALLTPEQRKQAEAGPAQRPEH